MLASVSLLLLWDVEYCRYDVNIIERAEERERDRERDRER